jgi:hypothetical protein
MPEAGLQNGNWVTGLQPPPAYTGYMSYIKPGNEQHATEHTGLLRRASRRPGRLRRAAAIAAALASVALLAAACGGSSTPSAATSPAQGGTTTNSNADALPYTQCMRAHGVPNFPDPSSQGRPFPPQTLQRASIDLSTPQYMAASNACAHLMPAPNPGQVAQTTSEQVRYAACMRAHGVPNFPDPSANGSGFSLTPSIMDAPDYRPAAQTCHSVDPSMPLVPPK